ncbi:DNA-binding protein [candidate division KSB1 bacterium]|nr:MAG: DNA-binding protein [candidate division KSB1 bacterium]
MSAKTKRLGKGLGALIPDLTDYQEKEQILQNFGDIEVDKIVPNPYQPREDFDRTALEELKNSIAERGVIQPITVRRTNDSYQLIAGERRWRAVKELGYEKIPAFIMEISSEAELLELALIENLQREDLNPIDVAKAYQRLMEECQLTQEQVAQKVGKDRTTITNFLRLLRLPEPIQASVRAGGLSMGHARALLALPDEPLQLELWKKIIRDNLSVRKVEELVKQSQKRGSSTVSTTRPKKSPHIVAVEDKFREVFGTQVHIYPRKEGGKIELEYYSDDDLDRIFDILNSLEESFSKQY